MKFNPIIICCCWLSYLFELINFSMKTSSAQIWSLKSWKSSHTFWIGWMNYAFSLINMKINVCLRLSIKLKRGMYRKKQLRSGWWWSIIVSTSPLSLIISITKRLTPIVVWDINTLDDRIIDYGVNKKKMLFWMPVLVHIGCL